MMHWIYDLCSANAKLCLKMCSQYFHRATSGTVRGLYQDISWAVDFGDTRFDRLCLDDTYTGLNKNRHVCSACRCLHGPEEFREQQLQVNPTTRVCEASQRSIILTYADKFTYQELVDSRGVKLPLIRPFDQDFNFRPIENQHGQWTIMMNWRISSDKVDCLTVYACPHLTSTEPRVRRALAERNENDILCSECNTNLNVHHVAAPAGYKDHWGDELRSIIFFHVGRKIGRLGVSAVDEDWKAQSQPAPQM